MTGSSAGQTFPLRGSSTLGPNLGDIQLQDTCVSTQHLAIRPTGSHGILQDLGSANGTFVDDHGVGRGAVPIGAGQEIPLANSVVLKFQRKD